ncbi:MAG: hypothetical protein ACPGQL_04030 [Thermoplasmatota archaeon]
MAWSPTGLLVAAILLLPGSLLPFDGQLQDACNVWSAPLPDDVTGEDREAFCTYEGGLAQVDQLCHRHLRYAYLAEQVACQNDGGIPQDATRLCSFTDHLFEVGETVHGRLTPYFDTRDVYQLVIPAPAPDQVTIRLEEPLHYLAGYPDLELRVKDQPCPSGSLGVAQATDGVAEVTLSNPPPGNYIIWVRLVDNGEIDPENPPSPTLPNASISTASPCAPTCERPRDYHGDGSKRVDGPSETGYETVQFVIDYALTAIDDAL